jgi:predicted negative regulator of RcsB-dependent stress response
MLKPKRKRTVKEIKQDPLLETVYKGQQLFEDNSQLIIWAGGGLIAIILIILLFRGSRTTAAIEADNILASAMSHYSAGNNTAAMKDLHHLIDDYGTTEFGKNALFYLSQVQFSAGNADEAKIHAETYLSKGQSSSYLAGSHLILAELFAREGGYGSAADHYLRAAKLAYTPVISRRNRLSAVRCYIQIGAYENAVNILNELEEESEDIDPLQSDFKRIRGTLQILSQK